MSKALAAFSVLCAVLAPGRAAGDSEAQLRRGETVYQARCQSCHGVKGDGGEEAPPLRGEAFWSGWDKQTARALYARIITSMPPDSPGTLAEKDAIDLMVSILNENGIAPGDRAISSAAELSAIKLSRRP